MNTNADNDIMTLLNEKLFEHQYLALVNDILGAPVRTTRNGDTFSAFAKTIVIKDLRFGMLPVLSGRKYHYKGVLGEFEAFIKQPKNKADFETAGCNYWGQWADEDGSLRLDYGNAWRNFGGVDQLANLISSLRNDPNGRRHLVSGWNPANLADLSLPCCHYAYQFYVTHDGYLDMLWHQRSTDVMLGLPADALLASIWLIALAADTGYMPGTITMTLGDTHIYKCHENGANLYSTQAYEVPLALRHGPAYSVADNINLLNFEADMIRVSGWYQAPAIKFEIVS